MRITEKIFNDSIDEAWAILSKLMLVGSDLDRLMILRSIKKALLSLKYTE